MVTLEGEGGDGPLSSPSLLDVAYGGRIPRCPQGPSLCLIPSLWSVSGTRGDDVVICHVMGSHPDGPDLTGGADFSWAGGRKGGCRTGSAVLSML